MCVPARIVKCLALLHSRERASYGLGGAHVSTHALPQVSFALGVVQKGVAGGLMTGAR